MSLKSIEEVIDKQNTNQVQLSPRQMMGINWVGLQTLIGKEVGRFSECLYTNYRSSGYYNIVVLCCFCAGFWGDSPHDWRYALFGFSGTRACDDDNGSKCLCQYVFFYGSG